MTVASSFTAHTIDQFRLLLRGGHLNLEPGFQRNSVWTLADRRRLIESIHAGYPLPSIFLYQRQHRGNVVYDVIDGKQRLETIFMFMGLDRFRQDRFEVKLKSDGAYDWQDWRSFKAGDGQSAGRFSAYKLQTVEVSGDLGEIIDLFVRINSTGKRLTSGEKRHARFYNSAFLKSAETLVHRFRRQLEQDRILAPAQIDRMKGTELFSELLMSLHNGGPINKKTALDRAIGNDAINGNTLGKLEREFIRVFKRIRRMLPRLREIRLRNSAEYYSLFLLVADMERNGLVLTDARRNRTAFVMLQRLSSGVDELRDQLRKARVPKTPSRLHQDYLLTVQGDTDSAANRQRRDRILRGLLWSLYEVKDETRLFTEEQRRILWHRSEEARCARCGKPLTWGDLTVDHVLAHSRGGRTDIKNAALMHRRCNAAKGAR